MEHIFVDIVAIILFSAGFGIIAHFLKQPLVLAYILAGVLLGPFALGLIDPFGPIITFSQIGVAFLLFLVGLNLSTRVFREVGRISVITGVGQVFFTTLIGMAIATFLGFNLTESFLIAIALSFSSTIVIVKLLSDKRGLDTLYGKISIGFLIIQDFIAIGVLVFLTGLTTGLTLETLVAETGLKLAALLAVPFLFNRFVGGLVHRVPQNHEMIFLAGVAWCFFMAWFSFLLGFSIEIGAFLAGMSLASLPINYEISFKIKPLRDFFLILFFVVLGSQLTLTGVENVLGPAVLLSLFVLVGNPLIVLVLMGSQGYRKKTSFLSGLTVAQISEFSLIIIALGASSGLLSSGVISLMVLVGIITIAVSSYFIMHGERIFLSLSRTLSVFERKRLKERLDSYRSRHYEIVLVGCHEMGHHILRGLEDVKHKILIVDFNPSIVRTLSRRGYHCLYGDITDDEVMEKVTSFSPSLVISSIPIFEDNAYLLRELRSKKRTIFVTVEDAQDALKHYQDGADYVFIPYMLGGEKATAILSDMVGKGGFHAKREKLRDLKARHLKALRSFNRWVPGN